ncbi:hypothetical protein JB92DRAFT_440082 [Gautieria morchelliformis]|nr:hypothetical protein JB92DRAFT_440082 [Gautieria morchelliformis]
MWLWKRVSSIPFIANMSTILFLLYVPGTFFNGSTATSPQHRNGNAIAFVWVGLIPSGPFATLPDLSRRSTPLSLGWARTHRHR